MLCFHIHPPQDPLIFILDYAKCVTTPEYHDVILYLTATRIIFGTAGNLTQFFQKDWLLKALKTVKLLI